MDLEDAIRRGRKIRALGFDDSPFKKSHRGDVGVAGVVCSNTRLEGMVWTKIRRDGWNATDKLIATLETSKFRDQIHLILTDGVAFGGFNVLELARIHATLGIPVASVMRNQPNLARMQKAIKNLPRASKRWSLVEEAGTIHESTTRVWFQAHGVEPHTINSALEILTDTGHIPEPIRLAHLIGSAVLTGESGRRA